MLRGQLPRLFPKTEPLRKDKARIIRTGSDIALLSAGICTEESMRATKLLQNRGVSITHLHISTLKPFTDTTIVEALGKATIGIITMENHTVIGGLGTCVAEMMAENAIGTRLIRIGLQDQYAHGASQPYLMRKYNLDAMALVETVEDLVGEKLGISEQDLAVVRLQEAAALDVTQLEAL
jgi:transketolase